ncbi:MAG TPA: hypothetical protein VGG89_00160 [Candidatus Baltobacteraceae bacterium]
MFCVGLLAGGFPLATPAQTPAPVRTLVYGYESRSGPGATGHPDNGGYGDPIGEISPDDCLSGGLKVSGKMSGGMDIGNGGIDWFQVDCKGGFGYHVGADAPRDRGSITIGMIGKQTDGSLVVQVTEAHDQRDASSVTCVVSPTTAIICDPSKPISLEEVTLLRFLSPGVVDSKGDQTHWKLEDGGPQSSFQATFAVLHNAAGVMTIDERRSSKGEAGPYSTGDSSSTFTYDVARAVPTIIDETLVQKTVSLGQYRTTERETLFRLQTPPSR